MLVVDILTQRITHVVFSAVIEGRRDIARQFENAFVRHYFAVKFIRVVRVVTGCFFVVFSIKNISANELNVDEGELTERFIRGDESRTTEGSGLGLSIAKNLTTSQGGKFDIKLDGDLFKAMLTFEVIE